MICQACNVEAPTKKVTFHQNIGALVMRFHKSVGGDLCKSCINKYFWKLTLTTLFLGWWGVISFFLTIGFLINNIVAYLGSLSLPAVPPGAVPPQLTQESWQRIQTQHYEIVQRLQSGQKPEEICQHVAPAAGVTPGQVYLYIQHLYNAQPATA